MKKLSVFLVLVVVFFQSGCKYGGIVSVLGTPSYHEIEVPAEYNLTEHTDQKILILVDQPGWLGARANLRYYLTRAIRKNLVEKVEIPSDCLVSYSELFEFRSNKDNFSLLSPVQVGEALDANMVLLVVIEDYQLEKMAETNYYKGFLSTRAVLLDVASGEKLWPKSARSRSVKVGFEVEGRGREIAVARLVAACAHCTTRYLYNCRKNKFKIAEDRSRVGWESWKK